MRLHLPLLALFVATIAHAQNATCPIVSSVTVTAGDTLDAISQLLFVNPQITSARSIVPGQKIGIPSPSCVAPAAAPLAEPTATCVNGGPATTKVVAGDTLIIIAKEKLGVTLPALLAVNPQIKNPDAIAVGDVVNIPVCGKEGGAAGGTAEPTGKTPTETGKPVKGTPVSSGPSTKATEKAPKRAVRRRG